MKIIIIGIPYFAKKIATSLAKEDIQNTYLAIDPGKNAWTKICYIFHLISASVLYQVGGSHTQGGALRLAMLLNRKIIMHWVGTDVLNLMNAIKTTGVDYELLTNSSHLCEVEWIQNELSTCGITSSIAQIACFENTIPTPSRFPNQFTILTYVGRGREVFYGIDKLIALARILPQVEIRVAGIFEYSEPLPPNMRLLGWVDDMTTEYKNCVLYLRLPEHDGLAFSVLEALACGRYVGYVNKFCWTQKIDNDQALVEFVKALIMKFDLNLLDINFGGYDFIVKNYSRDKVMNSLIEIIAS